MQILKGQALVSQMREMEKGKRPITWKGKGICEGMGAKEDVVSLGSGSSLMWLGQRSVKGRGGR